MEQRPRSREGCSVPGNRLVEFWCLGRGQVRQSGNLYDSLCGTVEERQAKTTSVMKAGTGAIFPSPAEITGFSGRQRGLSYLVLTTWFQVSS